MRGTLFLVVGPSGAGKDSIIAAARARLAGDRRFVFPRRWITRPAVAGGEGHRAVGLEAFRRMCTAGAFALWWEAHGRCYGIDAGIARDLDAGRNVVVNVSRTVIDEARRAFARLTVAWIEAPRHVLAARLAARGRETAAEIEARLNRAAHLRPEGGDVIVLRNDGPLDEAVAAFLDLLELRAGLPLSGSDA